MHINRPNQVALAISALCLSLAAPSVMAQVVETVANGDFSAGNSGFASAYTYVNLPSPPNPGFPGALRPLEGGVGERKYSVGTNPNLGHPRFIANLGQAAMIVNGGSNVSDIIWSQEVSLVAGVNYTFSGAASNVLFMTGNRATTADMAVEVAANPGTCASTTTFNLVADLKTAQLVGGTADFQTTVSPNWVMGTGNVNPTQTGIYCLRVRNEVASSTNGNDFALANLSLTGTLIPPVAADDNFTTPVDTPITGQTVATNDPTLPATPDFSVVTGSTNGTVTLNPDGTFVYTPNPGFTGTDTFTYQVCSGPGNAAPCSPPATVTVTVTPGPVAANDNYTTPVNTPVNNTVASNDGPLPATPDFSVVGQPTNGTVTMNPDGTFTYTPNTGFVGTDTFTYQVCSGPGNTAPCSPPATVTIQVGVAMTQPVPSLGLLGLLGLGAALAGLGARRRKQV